MIIKRIFDLFFTTLGLLILFPIFLLIALIIKNEDNGPVLFKQERVGLHGQLFNVLKFRTMVIDAEKKGAKVTTGNDTRITKPGYLLRKYKLDELPQLFNVLKGEMSLVGPRPEVPEYVLFYSSDMRKVILSVPPGITDRASIEFKDENDILTNSADPVKDYREKVLPIKLDYYKRYVEERSLWLDISLIIRTFRAILK